MIRRWVSSLLVLFTAALFTSCLFLACFCLRFFLQQVKWSSVGFSSGDLPDHFEAYQWFTSPYLLWRDLLLIVDFDTYVRREVSLHQGRNPLSVYVNTLWLKLKADCVMFTTCSLTSLTFSLLNETACQRIKKPKSLSHIWILKDWSKALAIETPSINITWTSPDRKLDHISSFNLFLWRVRHAHQFNALNRGIDINLWIMVRLELLLELLLSEINWRIQARWGRNKWIQGRADSCG